MDGTMARMHHKPEEIVAKLRQVDVPTGQGRQTVLRAPVRSGLAPVAEALQKPLGYPSYYLTEKACGVWLHTKSPRCGGLEIIRAFGEKIGRFLASAVRSRFGETL
jgi:hypothetical protein